MILPGTDSSLAGTGWFYVEAKSLSSTWNDRLVDCFIMYTEKTVSSCTLKKQMGYRYPIFW